VSAGALFLGVLLVFWLGLSLLGWLLATLRFRPQASGRALLAALLTGMPAAALPGVLGLDNLAGFFLGVALALLCSTSAAWHTMSRITQRQPWHMRRPKDQA
jgi:hypothetical protein